MAVIYTSQEQQELEHYQQLLHGIHEGYRKGTSTAYYHIKPLRDWLAQRIYEVDLGARLRSLKKKGRL